MRADREDADRLALATWEDIKLLSEQATRLTADNVRLTHERDSLQAENGKLKTELWAKLDWAKEENERLKAEKKELESDFDSFREHHRATEESLTAARAEIARLKSEDDGHI